MMAQLFHFDYGTVQAQITELDLLVLREFNKLSLKCYLGIQCSEHILKNQHPWSCLIL